MFYSRFLPLAVLARACCEISAGAANAFQAGAFAVDINPTNFPVRVNAMFTERSADKIVDPLFAKALAVDDGSVRLVFCVVDTCMMARDLIDAAKEEAAKRTGVPANRLLVSATHTHSAPSAMGCLGSRIDPDYAAFLPGRIAAAIAGAVERLAPAKVGWGQMDDWHHTFNRRWIRRPDKMLVDPFGQRTVRAHMHPGHQSPDAVGPSGPVDPELSVLAFQRLDGTPLALLANYSMHYYESPLLSSDYFGRFARHVSTMLEADPAFVAIMTQGTSGDLMWMDYGSPRRQIGYDAYAQEIASHVAGLVRGMRWSAKAPVRMTERKLDLAYRTPGQERLAWARQIANGLKGNLPKTLPEVYALEALFLHDKPRAELKLQAVSIGDLGIAALPNEVFALTGLKIKAGSPFKATFNIELANGAEGYIPPPEQHHLGGYTTWPARTAGLETNAEPQIVRMAIELLQDLAGQKPRTKGVSHGPYARSVLSSRPRGYWRFEEMVTPVAQDSAGDNHATLEPGVAVYLPGVDDRVGHQSPAPPYPNAFSASNINRSIHLAGGRVKANISLPKRYTIEMWFWNGLPIDARGVTGYLLSHRPATNGSVGGEHLGIAGSANPNEAGKLFLAVDTKPNALRLVGRSVLGLHAWHHVVLVRDGNNVRLHLDGRTEPELQGALPSHGRESGSLLFIGGHFDGHHGFEGKIDETAVYDRALTAKEIARHYRASGIKKLAGPVGTAESKP